MNKTCLLYTSYLIYPDDYAPYYFGEMMTNWTIPEIKREVEEIWQL